MPKCCSAEKEDKASKKLTIKGGLTGGKSRTTQLAKKRKKPTVEQYKSESLVTHAFINHSTMDNSKMSIKVRRKKPGDISDPESMNDILTNSESSITSVPEDIPVAKVVRPRSKQPPDEKKGKKLKKKRGRISQVNTASAEILDDSSGRSSVVSQLTYVEGMDYATGLGLGYRISTTVTDKTSKHSKRDKHEKSTLVI